MGKIRKLKAAIRTLQRRVDYLETRDLRNTWVEAEISALNLSIKIMNGLIDFEKTYPKFSVYVGGVEVNGELLGRIDAEKLLRKYKDEGYTDAYMVNVEKEEENGEENEEEIYS